MSEDTMVVTLTAGQLRAIVADAVKVALAHVAEPEGFVTVDVVAERAGVRPRTVQEWVREHGCPVHRPGGHLLRFRWSEVEAWIEKR